MYRVLDIFTSHGGLSEMNRTARKMRFWLASQIHDDFDEILQIRLLRQRVIDMGWHDTQQKIEVVCDFLAWQFAAPRLPVRSATLTS
jgi:hypothetical protein